MARWQYLPDAVCQLEKAVAVDLLVVFVVGRAAVDDVEDGADDGGHHGDAEPHCRGEGVHEQHGSGHLDIRY